MSLNKTKDKTFGTLWCFKVVSPLLILYLLFIYYIIKFPERIFESSILTIQYAQEILANSQFDKVSILAIGDSTIGAALNLDILNKDAYSLVAPGGNSRESFYILKKFLMNNQKPKCVLMNVSANNDSFYYEKFWKSFIVHLYSLNDLITIWKDSEEHQFHPYAHQNLTSFWTENYLSKLYLINFPWFQFIQSFRGMSSFIFSHQLYLEFIRKSRGQKIYKKTDFEIAPELEYLVKDFKPFPLDDFYFIKILDLLNEHQLELIYIDIPFAKVGNSKIEDFLAKNLKRKKELAMNNPYVHFFETQREWDQTYFSNINHLNEAGAIEYSKELKSQLPKKCLNF